MYDAYCTSYANRVCVCFIQQRATDMRSFRLSFWHLFVFCVLLMKCPLWGYPLVYVRKCSRVASYVFVNHKQSLLAHNICQKCMLRTRGNETKKNNIRQQLNKCLVNRIRDGWNDVNYTSNSLFCWNPAYNANIYQFNEVRISQNAILALYNVNRKRRMGTRKELTENGFQISHRTNNHRIMLKSAMTGTSFPPLNQLYFVIVSNQSQ